MSSGKKRSAVEAAETMVGWGGVLRMIEAPRLAGSIDLITCATQAPRDASGDWSRAVPGGSGVGLRWDDALVSTVGEAVERLAMVADADLRARWRNAHFGGLVAPALDPLRFNFFERERYGSPGFPQRPFSHGEVIPWCPGWSLQSGEPVWVPAEYVYFSSAGFPSHHWFATTSGVASHRNAEDALVSALCELVERDAFVRAWLRAEPLPRVAPERFADADIDEMLTRGSRAGVAFQLRDLTGSLGLPTYLAIAEAVGGGRPAFGLGAATRLDATTAARKAVLEAAHTWNWAYLKIESRGEVAPREDVASIPLAEFGDHVYLYAHRWMKKRAAFLFAPGPEAAPPPRRPALPAHEELAQILCRLRAAGHAAYAVDQTPDAMAPLGYVVMRAVVPELAPLQPGRRIQGLASTGLPLKRNPEPHPFP